MRFIIVTGLSGAGKSEATKSLEDMGYFCVDNLPPTLITKFADVCLQSDGKINKVALVIDIRGGVFFNDLFQSLKELEKQQFKYEILFLDASDEVLMKYTSTLEEAMCEYINCKNCKNILTCKNKVEGFCYKPEVVDNTLQFSYVMCKKKRDLEDAQSYLKNINYF